MNMGIAEARKQHFFWLVALIAFALSISVAHAQTIPDTLDQRLKACTACHGDEGRATTAGYYPRIAGKPAGYLFNQLRNFQEGKRSYPPMAYLVKHLSEPYLQEIAVHFSNQHPPYAAAQKSTASEQQMQRGKRLVQVGDEAQKIPACMACHGKNLTGVAPYIPGLLGLPRDYIVAQLGAWQTGSRRTAQPDCMHLIAQRLSASDVAAVSVWLAMQNLRSEAASPALLVHDDRASLPLECGSVPNAAVFSSPARGGQ
ncbi:MAG: cytochrome c4 [Burkholderiaceae bacterium]|nr:cytochrome c4 [Burkholderiaceae bacterium]